MKHCHCLHFVLPQMAGRARRPPGERAAACTHHKMPANVTLRMTALELLRMQAASYMCYGELHVLRVRDQCCSVLDASVFGILRLSATEWQCQNRHVRVRAGPGHAAQEPAQACAAGPGRAGAGAGRLPGGGVPSARRAQRPASVPHRRRRLARVARQGARPDGAPALPAHFNTAVMRHLQFLA